MYVTCISIRNNYPDQVTIGENYYIDLNSIYIDGDGDTFADVYKDREKQQSIGYLALKHFRSMWQK